MVGFSKDVLINVKMNQKDQIIFALVWGNFGRFKMPQTGAKMIWSLWCEKIKEGATFIPNAINIPDYSQFCFLTLNFIDD